MPGCFQSFFLCCSLSSWKRLLPFISVVATFITNVTTAHSTVAAPSSVDASQLEPFAVVGLVTTGSQTDLIEFGNQDHRSTLINELRRLGYCAQDVTGPASTDESSPALLSLGGAITEVNCKDGKILHCNIAIRWEIKERDSQQVLYRVTTRGREAGPNATPLVPKLLNAALHSLLSRPRFVELLRQRKHQAATPATVQSAAGFHECAHKSATMPEAAQSTLSATVLIESGDGLGSGSIISPDGFVLTANHVVTAGVPLHVTLSSGAILEATVVRRDLKHDVALLQVKANFATNCLTLRHDPVGVGEEVYAIGSPLSKDLAFSLTRGIVSGFRSIEGVALIQTDASVNPGNSGGPLVDHQGRLVAVVDFKIAGRVVQGLAFGVTGPEALEALGLHSAPATDDILLKPTPDTPAVATEVAVDDVDDPPVAGEGPFAASRGPSHTASALRTFGVITASVGLVGVGTSWLLYEAEKSNMQRGTFNTYLTINSISWAAVAVGTGSYVVSFLLRDPSSARRSSSNVPVTRVYAGIGPTSIVVGGEL